MIKELRVSPSNFCELSCGYCHITKSKNNKAASALNILPQAQSVTLACNSFYQDQVSEQIVNLSQNFNSVQLELHFLTVALERNQIKLSEVARQPASWIVHIDHLDLEKIQKLEKWNDKVAEYRLMPSQLYPAVLFLNHLPAFVQKKVKWALLGKDQQIADFNPLNTLDKTATDLIKAPLHDFVLSNLNWAHTFESQTPLVRSGLRWSVLDSLSYRSDDWPLQLSLLDSEYVGYLAAPESANVDKALAVNDGAFFTFKTPAHGKIQKNLASYLPASEKFHFLENFLVKKEIWRAYLKSYSVYDHWTWSDFLKQKNIQPELVTDFNSSSQLTTSEFHLAIQRHYQNTLDLQFYESYSLALHSNKLFRKFSYHFFRIALLVMAAVPRTYIKRFSRRKNEIILSIDDLQYSAASNLALIKKVVSFVLQRIFWTSHAKYWQSYDFTQKAIGRLYAIAVIIYWDVVSLSHYVYERGLYTVWWLYGRVVMPTIGFLISLFEFPKELKNEPWPKRWILKTQLFTKRWVWLALKIVRLR